MTSSSSRASQISAGHVVAGDCKLLTALSLAQSVLVVFARGGSQPAGPARATIGLPSVRPSVRQPECVRALHGGHVIIICTGSTLMYVTRPSRRSRAATTDLDYNFVSAWQLLLPRPPDPITIANGAAQLERPLWRGRTARV